MAIFFFMPESLGAPLQVHHTLGAVIFNFAELNEAEYQGRGHRWVVGWSRGHQKCQADPAWRVDFL